MSFLLLTQAAQYVTEEEDPHKARRNLAKFYEAHPESVEETLTEFRGF